MPSQRRFFPVVPHQPNFACEVTYLSWLQVSLRSVEKCGSCGGSKFRPSHWLGTSLIRQLVATVQAVTNRKSHTPFPITLESMTLEDHKRLCHNLLHMLCIKKYIYSISRDHLNSRFHGRDIFCEIGLLPRKTPISVKSVIFRKF